MPRATGTELGFEVGARSLLAYIAFKNEQLEKAIVPAVQKLRFPNRSV